MTGAEKLLRILQKLQKIDPEFPLQYAICLSIISLNEGLSLTELARKAGLSLSTTSRIVGALSQYRQSGNPYRLVHVKVAAAERRRKEIYLSPGGRETLDEICQCVVSGDMVPVEHKSA